MKLFRRSGPKPGFSEAFLRKYPHFEIGRHTYGEPQIFRWNTDLRLKIGSFCSIAAGVKIFLDANHRTDWVTTFPFNHKWDAARDIAGHPVGKGDVVIGNDVWIAADAMVLSGVTIGDGAVIGAGAVVSRDVGPYEIHAGNPARLIRKRFDDPVIERLLELKWWGLDDAQIEGLLPKMLSDDIEGFLEELSRLKS